MSKNKMLITLTALIPGVLAFGPVNAQTIGELAAIAKIKQVSAMPSLLPPPVPEQLTQAPKLDAPKANAGAMLVTSIYNSKDNYQAGISLGGVEVFVGPGDAIASGWAVETISKNSVIIKRCSSSKKCESKTIFYSPTH